MTPSHEHIEPTELATSCLPTLSPGAVPLEPSHSSSLSLRDRAIQADAGTTIEMSLSLLWKELSRGLCKVVESFFTDTRCYVVVASCVESPVPTPSGRRLEILESVMCGIGQKRVAIELNLAPSTIALNARLGLAGMGVASKPSRVHPLLMLAAKAACDRDVAFTGALSFVPVGDTHLRVISVPRPDRRLVELLPPAELSVVRSLVEGVCYEEIAKRRRTSTRTIANQITAVFRRMKVSGRNELLLRLFFAEGLGRGTLPAPLTETLSPPVSEILSKAIAPARRSA